VVLTSAAQAGTAFSLGYWPAADFTPGGFANRQPSEFRAELRGYVDGDASVFEVLQMPRTYAAYRFETGH